VTRFSKNTNLPSRRHFFFVPVLRLLKVSLVTRGFRDSRFPGFEVSGFRGFRDSRFPGFEVSGIRGFRDSRFPGCEVSGIRGFRDSRFPGCEVSFIIRGFRDLQGSGYSTLHVQSHGQSGRTHVASHAETGLTETLSQRTHSQNLRPE